MRKIIKFLLMHSFFKKYYLLGYFSPGIRGRIFVNMLFQRILGINRDTPWPVYYTSTVNVPQKIKIGKNVWKSFAVSGCCYIQGGNGIEIGDNTIFAPGVKIISANHNPDSVKREWLKERPIVIGKHCWIGTNAVILPGVILGDNTIVGAGAVVTKSFPQGNIIIAGNPAKVIREIR